MPDLPWTRHRAILDVLRDWDGSDELILPDERPRDPEEMGWAPGALDGVTSHGLYSSGPQRSRLGRIGKKLLGRRRGDARAQLTRLIRELATSPTQETRVALYELAMSGEPVIDYVDPVLEELAGSGLSREALQTEARWFVHNAADREPLKLAIALIGLAGSEADLPDLITLARHDEFSLYCVVAIKNLTDDPADALWEIARNVDGWGKVSAVERLSEYATDRPDIQQWLLRHGCANSIMDEYLAYICAVQGDLASALAAPEIDRELLDGALVILRGLIQGGPAEDLDDYEDGPAVVENALRHLDAQAQTLEHLSAAVEIESWLTDSPERQVEALAAFRDSPPAERSEEEQRARERFRRLEARGWTDSLRRELTASTREIIGDSKRPDLIRRSFSTGEDAQRWAAWSLAPRFDINLWDEAFERLREEPLNHTWFSLLGSRSSDEQLERLVRLAEETIPLDSLPEGPADYLFPADPHADAQQVLDVVVSAMSGTLMGSAPGRAFSPRLVAAALRSPVVRIRNMAAKALEHQPVEAWGSEVTAVLEEAAQAEPREDTKQELEKQLARANGAS